MISRAFTRTDCSSAPYICSVDMQFRRLNKSNVAVIKTPSCVTTKTRSRCHLLTKVILESRILPSQYVFRRYIPGPIT